MNPVDNYLECLHEGEKWDKVKAFAKKHKRKLITGAGLVGAYAAAKGGKAIYNRTPAGQASLLKKSREYAAQKEKDDKIVADLKRKDAAAAERNKKIGAALYAGGQTIKFATTPARYIIKKGVEAVGSGTKHVGKAVGNTIKNAAIDAKNRIKYRDKLK